MGAYRCEYGFVHKMCRCREAHTIKCDKEDEHANANYVPKHRKEMKIVFIKDLYVQCALQVRNFDSFGVAMSDCCGDPAQTAVEMADGKKMWRCNFHKGIRDINTQERGRVVYAIERPSTS